MNLQLSGLAGTECRLSSQPRRKIFGNSFGILGKPQEMEIDTYTVIHNMINEAFLGRRVPAVDFLYLNTWAIGVKKTLLVCGLEHFLFFHILGKIIPTY